MRTIAVAAPQQWDRGETFDARFSGWPMPHQFGRENPAMESIPAGPCRVQRSDVYRLYAERVRILQVK